MENFTKKLNTSVLLMGVLLCISCQDGNKEEIKGIKGDVNVAAVEQQDIEKMVPNQIISLNQAIEMKDEYNSSILPLIEKAKSTNGDQYQGTEFAYIDLDSLRKYVAFLEEVERLNNKKISGLRFYFASYPNQNKYVTLDKEPKYKGRETFFIAPTVEIEETELSKTYTNLKHVPFTIAPSGSNKYIGEFMPINTLFSNNNSGQQRNNFSNTPAVKKQIDDNTSLILNELQLTPPPKR